MHKTLETIQGGLQQVIERVRTSGFGGEQFWNAQGQWRIPVLTTEELIEEAQGILDLIATRGGDDLGRHEPRLQGFEVRLKFLGEHVVTQVNENGAQAVLGYVLTLQALRKALDPVLIPDDPAKQKQAFEQLAAEDSETNQIEPWFEGLQTMVKVIKHAHETVSGLNVEDVKNKHKEITALLADAQKDEEKRKGLKKNAEELDKQLCQITVEANEVLGQCNEVLGQCERAYSAATSVGLAMAFSERSRTLSHSMWVWVGGLVLALAVGSYFGSVQLHSLTELANTPNVAVAAVLLNLLLSVLSVGAPVWFGWLSTKQIGQRFRLAEDYAFKASISRAYEGFRREAERFDSGLDEKLLASALSRFDELPLRLVEADTYGSPWHELLSSSLVRRAALKQPDFGNQVIDLAKRVLGGNARPAAERAKEQDA